ncbi:Dehydrogenase OS=Streptomyces glaucescens OX=1907 GN=SGLAU_26875 PE=3 SV=1 [Streptomyces glaucescens]
MEVVRGERANPCDGREALQALRIAEACERSRREHQAGPPGGDPGRAEAVFR